MYLYDKLVYYAEDDYYPFHMPGHKRNVELMNNFNPYSIDITEIDGFDNLHDPEDIILQSMKRTAKLYHSQNTLYLVNGSTSGILTGISACTRKGDKILMARNCHKSAYHAVFLNELNPVYLYPQINNKNGIQCGYSAKYIEDMLIKHEDVKLIVLVSPTYEGTVSDIREICEIAHERKILVLVDEAHGAHFR
ncbi:MAG: aminotransferase class I/II-fold pyridoxal phosphate-dependent enzyme, partial [Clostridium sp.]|nr:aminotransferase class I/II-fold pyridoxal phosphate-dependent enzyme [Clostridium sp.]